MNPALLRAQPSSPAPGTRRLYLTKLNRNVPPIRPPQFFKAMDKCRDQRSRRRIALRVSHQHADTSHLLALLCPRRKRPSYRRATQKCDELAPSHCLLRGSGQILTLGSNKRWEKPRLAAWGSPITGKFNKNIQGPTRVGWCSCSFEDGWAVERPAHARFGSEADMCSAKGHVRFTPESGHVQCTNSCPLWARSRHSSRVGVIALAADSFQGLASTALA